MISAMTHKGWRYRMDEEKEDDNIKYFHYAVKFKDQKWYEEHLDLDPYQKLIYHKEYADAVDAMLAKKESLDLTERYRIELAEARARIAKLEKYIIDKLLNAEL